MWCGGFTKFASILYETDLDLEMIDSNSSIGLKPKFESIRMTELMQDL